MNSLVGSQNTATTAASPIFPHCTLPTCQEIFEILTDSDTTCYFISHLCFTHRYRIVGFFEVLKFHEWLIFNFFTILFSEMGQLKAHTLQWVVGFFEGLNFMNDQHPRNSWNLRTSKKTNYIQ